MLVRRETLERIGGIASIKSEIIDDCALARRLKTQGPIRLDMTRRAVSLRPYAGLSDIGRMVSRSAYAQLDYSPVRLMGTVVGMAITYLVPAMLALFYSGSAQTAGLGAWLLMVVAFQPTLRFYRVSPLWGVALAGDSRCVYSVHRAVRDGSLARPRRHVEGSHPGESERARDRRKCLRFWQGPSGRKLPGGVVARPPPAARANSGLLSLRAHRRRRGRPSHRRSPAKARSAGADGSGAARRGRRQCRRRRPARCPAGVQRHRSARTRPSRSLSPRRHHATL